MRNRYKNSWAIAAMALMIGVTYPGCRKPGEAAGPPQAGPPEVAVFVVHPERVVITTDLPGRVAPHLIAEVRPQVGGIIQKRLFNEGSDVKEGDVLYQIDPASYQATLDNAAAALAKAEANLPPVQLRVSRYKEAVAAKSVSQQAYDDALAALKQAEADIEYGKAAVESARINLGYTRVTAPISGRIGRSSVTAGALVSAHQALPLATIQQLDPVYVDASQSSARLLRVKRKIEAGRLKESRIDQAPVKLLLEDGTPYPLEGVLKFSEAMIEPSMGSFIFRMVFPNPDHTLLPGMYVRAVVQEGVVVDAIMVPQQGVARDPKGNPVVMLVGTDGKVQQRMISVDRAIGDKWLVSSGLAPGDEVIIEGLQKIRVGVAVKKVSADDGRAMASQPATAAQPTSQPN